MSLKTRLRIAIVALVTLVVIAMSLLYLYDFTRVSFEAAANRADLVAKEVKGNLVDRLERQSAARGLAVNSVPEAKVAWTDIIRHDSNIADMLKRTLGASDLVVAILVTDEQGSVLAASNPDLVNTALAPATDFNDLTRGNGLANLWDLLTRRTDYITTRPIGVGAGENTQQVLFQVTVVIRSVLLKHAVEPALKNLALAFGASLFIAIFLGSVLPSFILDPLERVSRNIDLIRTGQFAGGTLPVRESREFADVQSKLSLLGEQYRGALDMRSNVEQLLQRLDEAVLLFDNAGRLIMAGESADRMLGKRHDELIGRRLEEVFPPGSVLGEVIGSAVGKNQSVRDQQVTVSRSGANALRLVVTVEVLRKSPRQEHVGVLVTLRDIESRRQVELQLGVSSRLAAISRLTGGVAHEIKNPLNAMALHLEVLKSKVDGDPAELEVIAREIKRLDNVVKTFLNFNKPVELQARPIDLNQVVEHVVDLVSVDARAKNVEVDKHLKPGLWINGDPELLQQAILNVVNNGLEAMREGGKLEIRSEWTGEECQVTIADAGGGVPPEIRDRIFNLYFTTKEHGTGIGLATTFRVVQLHSGTIDFVSEQGKGTTFRFRFPGMVDYQGEALTSASGSS